jgi:hypothetical protein
MSVPPFLNLRSAARPWRIVAFGAIVSDLAALAAAPA